MGLIRQFVHTVMLESTMRTKARTRSAISAPNMNLEIGEDALVTFDVLILVDRDDEAAPDPIGDRARVREARVEVPG